MNDNQKEIDGDMYSFGMLPAVNAVKFQVRLGKMIAPLIEVQKTEGSFESIGTALEKLTDEDVMYLLNTMAKYTSVGNERCNIDQHFKGKTLTLYKVLFEFIRYNFADFFQLMRRDLNITELMSLNSLKQV